MQTPRASLLGLTAVAALVILIPRAASAQSAEAAARSSIDAATRKFIDAGKRGDVAGLLALYAPDAVFVDADGTRTQGRAGFDAYLKAMVATATIKDWRMDPTTFHAEGGTAYEAGTEHVALVDKKTGKPSTMDLQFLVVFRQQADKRWLLAYGMETPMPPKK